MIWRPQPGPQKALIDCPLPEIFYGGARGGGKTDGVLGKWALKEQCYGKHFNAIMFRRTTVSSDDAIERSKEIYAPIGGRYNESKYIWRMPHGGRVSFKYLETTKDADEYQGRNVTDAWVEEVGQYPDPKPIDRLNAVLRSAHGVPTQLILTGNPGGAGQHWLAERYGLIPLPNHPKLVTRKLPTGKDYIAAVIPSRLWDNKVLLHADPAYVDRLYLSGSKKLVDAWLNGDWAAIEGAFFDCWDTERHVLRPFEMPNQWLRFRSLDWGTAKPFSVGWWAVVSDDYIHDGKHLPRGALIRYREWYGKSEPNVGIKLTSKQVAEGIKEREDEEITYSVADPSIFACTDGPSIAENMADEKVYFTQADNRRVPKDGAIGGWDQLRIRLKGEERPMIYCFSTCTDSIRTIPVLQHDERRAEDLDTNSEDHAADEWRYACMSRPWIPSQSKETKPETDAWGRYKQTSSWKTN